MPSCKEVAYLVSSGELVEAAWANRVLARLHFITCRECRRYASQLQRIGEAARNTWDTRLPDVEELAKLHASIMERCLRRMDGD